MYGIKRFDSEEEDVGEGRKKNTQPEALQYLCKDSLRTAEFIGMFIMKGKFTGLKK
jgi:hypothetical protein